MRSSSGLNTSRGPSRGISPSLIVERKQKRLCCWCWVKFQAGHRCVNGKLYHVLLESNSNGEGEDFQKCSEQLEENPCDEKPQGPVVPLHDIKGPQTMRFEASLGNIKAIVLVDSSSTHNFINPKLGSKLSLPIEQLEQLRVTMADGRSIFTRGIVEVFHGNLRASSLW